MGKDRSGRGFESGAGVSARQPRCWMLRSLAAFGALLAFAGGPAHAESRTLPVPANSGWQHAATGLVLRAKLAGLDQRTLADSGTAELDVVADFATPDQSTVVTFYIFRPALMSVPVWFDRSETQILLREEYRNPRPVADARAFAPPSSDVASALRRSYATGSAAYAATGLAIVPMGEWLVAIRISARDPDPAGLDSKLDEVIAAIGWPEGLEDSEPAALVAACPTPLKYSRRAKLQRPNMTDAILGAALSGIVAERADAEAPVDAQPVTFCRDAPGKAEYGVYRNVGDLDRDAYLMAVADAGRTVSVAPSLGALVSGSKGYMLSFSDLDRTLVYPNFDRLPTPDKALETVQSTAPISSTARDGGGGSTITIDTGGE